MLCFYIWIVKNKGNANIGELMYVWRFLFRSFWKVTVSCINSWVRNSSMHLNLYKKITYYLIIFIYHFLYCQQSVLNEDYSCCSSLGLTGSSHFSHSNSMEYCAMVFKLALIHRGQTCTAFLYAYFSLETFL